MKAWADSVFMRDLDRPFLEKNVDFHGEDVWLILFWDHLRAHFDEEVKKIFGKRKVLLFSLPLDMTNFLHSIDAGLGRSERVSGVRHFNEWLINNDNI